MRSLCYYSFGLVAVLLFLSGADAAQVSPENFLVDTSSLPGIGSLQVPFDMYAGYIQLPGTGKHSYFMFYESQSKPETDPLLLWLNGGPGASSVYGAMKENGPFHVGEDLMLSLNPHSWNLQANVLYLESPVAVGFSYSTDDNDYIGQNDNQTAEDNYAFLLSWFDAFDSFKENEFYISGESYGGHYCPQLAYTVVTQNALLPAGEQMNLQGILVGNAWTDEFWDGTWSPPRYAYGRGLMSAATYEQLMTECDGMFNTTTQACQTAMGQWKLEQGNDGILAHGFNQLMLYEPCYPDEILQPVENEIFRHPIGCVNCTAITAWLNNPSTMSAIHATLQSGQWGAETALDYTGQASSVLDLYPTLMDTIKVVIYSGDSTTNVNFMGSDAWIRDFGQEVTDEWRQWTWTDVPNLGQQVAGWTIGYEKIRFVTVLGAGHMVPQYRPGPALAMLQNYLFGSF